MVRLAQQYAPARGAHSHTGLSRWQSVTREGNQAFEQGDFSTALSHYQEALDLAQRFAPEAPDAAPALVVSHHNLAELHERQGQSDDAARHLCRAHEALCARAADDSGEESIRVTAWRHTRVTYAALLRFLQRHPEHAAAQRAARLSSGDGPFQTLPN
ncbi:Protein of uncharacterised function (DUF2753) [Bordetella ansorpii]|uniref:Protein of uncharacterized function (DUF2753) n=1 Tax=Bordetella ansorpii TaxID=288768 RepID=A0A157NZ23_9BORD|nr:DUF2753 family protein [Bordetella ansorpii]SAI26498.1 Protein of uncharacterised function (DUF2753) [Bordetella ansorpii]